MVDLYRHIPADWLGNLSIRNFALCDATEVFVLLAGYAGGLAYGTTMRTQGWLYAAADVVRRAWTLYIAHIFLFVVFAAQVGYSATALDRNDYLDEIHLDVMGGAPYRALLEAITLHFQPAYLNILPLYIVVLLMFALAMPLLNWPAGAGGAVARPLCRRPHLGPEPAELDGGGWFFNPFTWQLLFMMGAILSFAPGGMPRRKWPLDAMSVLVVLFGLLMQWVVWVHPGVVSHLPDAVISMLMSVDKGGLHPFRLISILALTWLTARLVPAPARWLRSRIAEPFVLAGQHSLPVFCAGIFLAFLGRLATEADDGVMVQIGVNLAGAVSLTAVAAVAAWYSNKGRGSRGKPARLEAGV
ncbi:MAG: OpgC domain-containing protein [Rhodospirillales bacterium]